VIQELFSIGMGLESARGLVGIDSTRMAQRLDAAIDAIDGTIRDLRNAIFRLRPHTAAALGLTRVLVELAREYEVDVLTRPTVDVPGIGFDSGQVRAGRGLDNICERAQALGVDLQVNGAPGGGTAICLRVPSKEAVSWSG
jgi:signal transduction histidine kinase